MVMIWLVRYLPVNVELVNILTTFTFSGISSLISPIKSFLAGKLYTTGSFSGTCPPVCQSKGTKSSLCSSPSLPESREGPSSSVSLATEVSLSLSSSSSSSSTISSANLCVLFVNGAFCERQERCCF